jgi:hypothetical protein
MANWKHRIKIKHLFTENEDYESVQKSMNAVADVLEKDSFFKYYNVKKFRKIPKGDDVFGPVDYANKLIEQMYNYADDNLIWIE